MKIAIVVHGRFHGFDLARALLQRGHEVTLFTNYPKWAVEHFGVSGVRVRSFWLHGVISRLALLLQNKFKVPYPESWLHRMFGRWASKQVACETWDVVHSWSGIAEEGLRSSSRCKFITLVMRGSAHIRVQARILQEESARTGTPLHLPSKWMIARETREYALADRVIVLSNFAYESFVFEGVPHDKISLLPLGALVKAFRPPSEVIRERCQRIRSGQPLRVLYVGAISLRKGALDLESIFRQLSGERFEFCVVGPVLSEAATLVAQLTKLAKVVPKQPQHELPQWYAWGDVFVFPTIEDGFAVVLAQANASALPILTTTNCAGPDMIQEGETGWVLPIRSPEAFIERLRWCDSHRKELAAMVQHLYDNFRPRDWSDVAKDFETLCEVELEKKKHATRMMERPRGCS